MYLHNREREHTKQYLILYANMYMFVFSLINILITLRDTSVTSVAAILAILEDCIEENSTFMLKNHLSMLMMM